MPFEILTKHILTWLRRRILQRYSFRPAKERDLDFIMEEVLEGAKHGHYAQSLLEPEQAQGFRDQLRGVISHSVMLRGTDRGPEKIRAQLWVYGRNGDDQVGYLLVSEKLPGTLATEIELYKAGVRKDRRKKGHGRRIVQLFVAYSPPSVKLYARCLPPSDTMFKLLQEVGFSHINTMRFGTRELVWCAGET